MPVRSPTHAGPCSTLRCWPASCGRPVAAAQRSPCCPGLRRRPDGGHHPRHPYSHTRVSEHCRRTRLRLPSELAAIATIPLLYLLARRLYSHHIGLLASALGAASPFWIWHAQEARMYSFLVLFGTTATLGLVYAVEDRRIWVWVLFTLATGLGIYFHYFAFAVLAAHLVYVLIR